MKKPVISRDGRQLRWSALAKGSRTAQSLHTTMIYLGVHN